jgi:hypothetical protein
MKKEIKTMPNGFHLHEKLYIYIYIYIFIYLLFDI